jgi:muramoyltetrapeptide carboxypeptidase
MGSRRTTPPIVSPSAAAAADVAARPEVHCSRAVAHRGISRNVLVVACGVLLVGGGCAGVGRRPLVKAAPLEPGDTIAFVAPAGHLDEVRMTLARERLEALGYEVRVPDDLYRQRGYLAGPDDVRAAELMAAFADPEVDAIFPGTGNYGTTRMLDRLDYDVIRRNPKIFIGFSDLTALHLAILKRAGLVTFHSPNPMWGLGSESNLTPFSEKSFWRALCGPAAGEDADAGWTVDCELVEDGGPQPRALVGGVARGPLVGGNLTLVGTLMGTPYEIETDGAILFIEDVGERPYRIDRYLSQLRLAGKLDRLAGVIIGVFRDCDPKPDEESLSLAEVFADYFADLGVPVLVDFPIGHSVYNATLPVGVEVEVDADAGVVRVCEDPLRR